jgi:hypothetical protein
MRAIRARFRRDQLGFIQAPPARPLLKSARAAFERLIKTSQTEEREMRTACLSLSRKKNERTFFWSHDPTSNGSPPLLPAQAERPARSDADAACPAIRRTDLVRADNAQRVSCSRWLRCWFRCGPDDPAAHGWSGHAAQFDAWIEPWFRAGYRAVLFDAPAHGRSGGPRPTHGHTGAVQHVAGLHGPVHAIVAHSSGHPPACSRSTGSRPSGWC